MKKFSEGEELLVLQLKSQGIPFRREVKFHPTRKWRFDFVFPPEFKIAAEVEGGVFSFGGHSRGKGYEKDCEKYNEAILLGWRVLRFTTDMVKRGEALQTIERALDAKEVSIT